MSPFCNFIGAKHDGGGSSNNWNYKMRKAPVNQTTNSFSKGTYPVKNLPPAMAGLPWSNLYKMLAKQKVNVAVEPDGYGRYVIRNQQNGPKH